VECDAQVNNTTPSTAGSQSTTAGQTQNQSTAGQPRGRTTAQQQPQTTAQPQSQSTAQQQQTTAQTQQQSQPSPGQTGKHQTTHTVDTTKDLRAISTCFDHKKRTLHNLCRSAS